MDNPDHHRLRIDWLRTVAGALAAVSSAVLLSTLGAAGTIIGAAVGSVVVSVMSSLYSQGLARSRQRMAAAQAAAVRRVGVAQAEVRRAHRADASDTAVDAHLDYADAQLAEAKVDLDSAAAEVTDGSTQESLRDRFVALPWGKVALAAGGVFLIAVLAITAFELIVGRPVSSYTGGTKGDNGTTFSRIGHDHPGVKKTPAPQQVTPTPTSSASVTPTDSASPTATPSATDTASTDTSPSPAAPTATVTVTETASSTPTP